MRRCRDWAVMRLTSGQQDGYETPLSICKCVDLRVAPSTRTAHSLLLLPPFPPAAERCAFTCVELDHLRVCRSSISGKLPEQVLPDAASCPTNKPVIDRGCRTIFGRAIAPAATAPQHMHDPADDPPIVHPLDTPHISRQMRLDPTSIAHRSTKTGSSASPDLPEQIRLICKSILSCYRSKIIGFWP